MHNEKKKILSLTDKKGIIKIESVNKLEYNDIKMWIRAVLREENPNEGGYRDELPHGFIKRVYRELNPLVRAAFGDATLSHLNDLANNHESEWQGNSADELLLLVGALFSKSKTSEGHISLLLHIAEQNRFRNKNSPNLHLRALQTLVRTGYRATPNFWKEHYRIGGKPYTSTILAGLSTINLSVTLEWLKEQAAEYSELNDVLFNAFINRLPWLSQIYGAHEIEKLINSHKVMEILLLHKKMNSKN